MYPPLFHVIFGNLNRVLGLEPYFLWKSIEVLQFAGLLLGFYFFARPVIRSPGVLACSLLAISLVFYAPTGRYYVSLEPPNCSYGFVFFGLGFLVRYHLGGKPRLLLAGSLLLGVATAMWWYHILTLFFFAVFLAARTSADRPRKTWGVVAASCLMFSAPMLFEVWHFCSVRSVLPEYAARPGFPNFPRLLWRWFETLVTKGNDQFFHYLSPWEALRLHRDKGWKCGLYVVRALFLSADYFLLVIPFNIVMCISSIRCFARVRTAKADPHATLIKSLMYAAALATIFSAAVLLRGDMARLRRCQFVIFPVLLAVGMEGMRMARPNIERSRWFRAFFAVAFCSMLLAPVYSPQLVVQGYAAVMSDDTRALIRFIGAIPNHQDERLFFPIPSMRIAAPYVSFCCLFGRTGDIGDQASNDSRRGLRQHDEFDERLSPDRRHEGGLEGRHGPLRRPLYGVLQEAGGSVHSR